MNEATLEVIGVPEYAIYNPYPYWLVEVTDGKAYFKFAYREKKRAEEVARENGLLVVRRNDFNGEK